MATALGTGPSPVRVRISSRSNSARPPKTVNISLPCAVVVSAQVSRSDLKPAPFSATAPSRFRSSRVDLASRSSQCHHQNVAFIQRGYKQGKLLPVRPRTADLLLVNPGARGGLQFRQLSRQRLAICAYAGISELRCICLHFRTRFLIEALLRAHSVASAHSLSWSLPSLKLR